MIRKRTSPSGPIYEVWIYDSAIKRKRYVGTRRNLRGKGGALELEREKAEEFGKPRKTTEVMTCARYVQRWLERRHGPGTRRPSPHTRQLNAATLGQRKDSIRPDSFLALFGERPLRGGVSRAEALDWAREHPTGAKVAAAMFADAIDEEHAEENPFANRRLPQKRGRRDIEPLTEPEVARLADLALSAWGNRYGLVVAGWILFLAWTGCRPGEAAAARRGDLDVENGLLTVPRIKGDKQTDEIVLPPAAVQALERMPLQHAAAPADQDRLFLTIHGKPYTIGSYGYYWKPVRAAFVAGLEPERREQLLSVKGALDPYSLRHFCGSIMADRGASARDIAAQLGNSEEVCRQHYIHDFRDRVNERNRAVLSDNLSDLGAARRRRKGA